MLGQMLFNGDSLPRQAARGLMWLTLARDSAAPDETWIKESYNRAIAKASDDDRAMALQMLEHWVQGRRDCDWSATVSRAAKLTAASAHYAASRSRSDPDRHVVRRLLPGADMAVDADTD